MKRRIISLFLVAALVFSMVCMVAAGAPDLQCKIGDVKEKLEVGKTISVPVNVTSNAGIVLGEMDVKWPNAAFKLTAVDFTDSVVPDVGELTPQGKYIEEAKEITGDTASFHITVGNMLERTNNFTDTGTLFVLKFEVLSGATVGKHTVSIVPGDFTNTSWTFEQTAAFTDGSVELYQEIASPAEVAVTEPAKGAAPTTTLTGDYYTGTIAWSSGTIAWSSGTFAANTVYTATVTLTANTGYVFKDAAAKVNGESVSGKLNTAMTVLTFTKTFPATASKALDHLTVAYKNGGSKAAVKYLDGEDALKSQLNVTAVYDDASTEAVTSYTLNDFDAGKDTRPGEPKADFPVAVGTDKKCEVAYGGLTAAVAYDVTPLDLADAELTNSLDRPWTGSPVSISGMDLAYGVKVGDTVLYAPFATLEGTIFNDYTITASAGQEICTAADKTAYVTISGVNNFTGEKTFYFAITKATPNLGTVAVSGNVYNSTALKDVVLTRTDTTVAGTLALDAGQTLTAGTKAYNYTFTPTDGTHYETVTGTVEITVLEDAIQTIVAEAKQGVVYHYGDTPSKGDFTVTATFASGESDTDYKNYTITPATITGYDAEVGDTRYVDMTITDVTDTTKVATLMVPFAVREIDASDSTFSYQYSENGSVPKALPEGNKIPYSGKIITINPFINPAVEYFPTITATDDVEKTYVGDYEANFSLKAASGMEEFVKIDEGKQPKNGNLVWSIVPVEQDLTPTVPELTVRPVQELSYADIVANFPGLKGKPTFSIVGETYNCSFDEGTGSFIAGDKATADGKTITVKITAEGCDVNSDSKAEYLPNTEGNTFQIKIQDLPSQAFTEPKTTTFTYGQRTYATVAVNRTTGNGAVSYAVTKGSDVVEVNASTGALTIKKAGSATVTVTAAETTTFAMTTKVIQITVNKADQVIYAPPTAKTTVFMTGDVVTAKVTTGDGAITYAVTEGMDVLDIDPVTGELDGKKAGTATVTATAEETDNYAEATRTIKVTVERIDMGSHVLTAYAQMGSQAEINISEALHPNNDGCSVTVTSWDHNYFTAQPTVEGIMLMAQVGNRTGKTTVIVNVSEGALFKPYTVKVELNITEKPPQVLDITGLEPSGVYVYGTEGTATVNRTTGDGAINAKVTKGDDVLELNVGRFVCKNVGEAEVTVTADETDNYAETTKVIKFQVFQKPVQLVTLDLTATPCNAVLEDILDRDQEKVALNFDEVEVKKNADGSYTATNFVLTGSQAKNYYVSTVALSTPDLTVAEDDLATLTVKATNCTVDALEVSQRIKGQTVTLTATVDANCKFSGWQIGGEMVSTANPYTFTLTNDTEITAIAKKNTNNAPIIGPGGGILPSLDAAAMLTKTQIVLTVGQKDATVFGETKSNDVAPVIRNNRTMLPARFVAEALGAAVGWDAGARTVTITRSDVTIKLTIGSDKATVNGVEVTLDSPAFIQDNRTYLPLRFISESLKAIVEWNETTRQVTITKQ